MKMDSDIRVRIDKQYDQVYNTITKGLEIESHVLFFICFCIAVAKKIPPIPLAARNDKFWSRTFSSQEWTSMYSVILEMNSINLKSIESDEKVIRQIESFANAGMQELLSLLPEGCIRNNNNVLSVAIDDKGEIIKTLLYTILDIYISNKDSK